MQRNNKNKDVLDTMDIYDYIAELMKIPTGDTGRRYNTSDSAKHGGKACITAREFGSYRSLCLRENAARRRIAELIRQVDIAEKSGAPRLPVMRSELRQETLRLADLTLRRRRLEERRDRLSEGIVKMAVQYRYFDEPERRMPTWNDTVKTLGIALSGDELRRYVCKCFDEQLR